MYKLCAKNMRLFSSPLSVDVYAFLFVADASRLMSGTGTGKRHFEWCTPESIIPYCGREWFTHIRWEHAKKVGFLTHSPDYFVKLAKSKPGLMVQIMEKAFSQLRLADLRCALRDTRCSLCVHCDSPVATTGHIGWLIGCQVGKEESAIYCQILFIDVIHLLDIWMRKSWKMLTLKLSGVKCYCFEGERNKILWDTISSKGLHLMMLLLWDEY